MRLHLKLFNGILLAGCVALIGCSKAPVSEIQDTPTKRSPQIKTVAQKPSQDSDTKADTEEKVSNAKPTANASANSNDSSAKGTVAVTAEKEVSPETKIAERNEQAAEKLKQLNSEYSSAVAGWRKKRRSARTPEQIKAWTESDPKNEFGKQFLSLAEEYSGTEGAKPFLLAALRNGAGEAKSSASEQLLELASMDFGTLESEGILVNLAQSGSGEHQKKAIEQILTIASAEPSSPSATRLLDAMLQVRGMEEEKNKAAQIMIDQADSDIRSNQSAKKLVKIATSATGNAQAAALSRLADHHINNPELLDIMTRFSRGMPNAAAENWLKDVCRKATDGKVKSNAAISLSKLIGRRDSYANYYAEATDEVRERAGKELLAYLEKTPDPNETTLIESTLDEYVKGNEKLVESVKKELFVIQNLAIGKEAPEITANDLDGVEFNLSDYRGKVVFLDFWGDW